MSQEQKLQKRDYRTYTTPPPVNRRIIGIPEARVFSTCTVSSMTLLRPTTTHGGVPELMTHQLLESCRNRLSSRRSMSNTCMLWTRITFSPIGMLLQAAMALLLKNLDGIEKRILVCDITNVHVTKIACGCHGVCRRTTCYIHSHVVSSIADSRNAGGQGRAANIFGKRLKRYQSSPEIVPFFSFLPLRHATDSPKFEISPKDHTTHPPGDLRPLRRTARETSELKPLFSSYFLKNSPPSVCRSFSKKNRRSSSPWVTVTPAIE